jgi:formate-dependent nitrite reductase membrane component NrfD
MEMPILRLHNLWYNPLLPLLFWVSAISSGLCIIILEATACHKWMEQPNEGDLLVTLSKILPCVSTCRCSA